MRVMIALPPYVRHTADVITDPTLFILTHVLYCTAEVINDHKATPASDIYSLGVMMWSLYSGQTPWLLADPQGAFTWNPHFACLDAAAPALFVSLMLACLSGYPAQRPSAREVAAQLEVMAVRMGLGRFIQTAGSTLKLSHAALSSR